MRLLLALLLVTSCAPAPQVQCTTRCGVDYLGLTGGGRGPWTCENLQFAESKAVALFADVTDLRFRFSCSSLSGWDLYTNPASSWTDSWGRHIGGQADCIPHVMEVGNYIVSRSSLAHEMAHAIQGCMPLPAPDGGVDMHANWHSDGIYRALDKWSND